MANLTDADLVSIRSLPPAIALQGTDIIPLGQLIGGSEEARGGTINQLIALLPSSPGDGITWTEYTASATLTVNTGVLVASTTDTEFILPDAASVEVGDRVIVQGKGSGIWSLTGATIYAIGGASGTGLRRLVAHPFAACELRAIDSVSWVIISPPSLEFIEFFSPGDGSGGAPT